MSEAEQVRPDVGKSVGRHLYAHVEALTSLDTTLQADVGAAVRVLHDVEALNYNVLRFERGHRRIALLHYPDFFETPFPVLAESWFVDLETGRTSYRTYVDSVNPPLLHRKELLLPGDHPEVPRFAELTVQAEGLGLFDDPLRIGFRSQWEALVAGAGYTVSGHSLVPIANEEAVAETSDGVVAPVGGGVARHLTALVRQSFSAPVQSLDRYGLLTDERTLFDYGCGRGDDVRGLTENGINACGWDPHYAPSAPRVEADIVNLGFVINVIEDFDERVDALSQAFGFARQLLVISAMLESQNTAPAQRYRDGVITQRGTFQKYYSQGGLHSFIAAVLDEEPIAVGPGVFYVFRDKDVEQQFLASRYRSHRALVRHRALHPVRDRRTLRERRAAERYAHHADILEPTWELWLELGRTPEADECPHADALADAFGSYKRALRFVEQQKGSEELERAQAERRDDIEVYLALNVFEQRQKYSALEPRLQRDIKSLFGSYTTAQQAGNDLLFRIASPEAVEAACKQAAEHGLGCLEQGESLQLHTSLVEQLPALLRVYVAAACTMYGDHRGADLIKIHINSGKVSLMSFDDFAGSPLPRMLERVKLNMRAQDISYFVYGDAYEPPYLYIKSRYINEEFEHYAEQVAFDEALEAFDGLDLSGYGPSPTVFDALLSRRRYEIADFVLRRSREIPPLSAPCGDNLTFADLVQCGETQSQTGLSNLPREPDSYSALLDLAAHILDPVIDYFGMIELTYGFCSPELSRKVPGRNAPKLDQHAAHERNRLGNPVCPRLGAAVDFLVHDEDMREVAEWVAANTPFDRLYFYGSDKPVHVSYGPEQKGEFVEMLAHGSRRVPRVRTISTSRAPEIQQEEEG